MDIYYLDISINYNDFILKVNNYFKVNDNKLHEKVNNFRYVYLNVKDDYNIDSDDDTVIETFNPFIEN